MEEIKIDKCVPGKAKWFLGILSLFVIALIVSTALDIQLKVQEAENTITVNATGEVYAKPDLALTTFSVITEAEGVTEAMSENTEKMNAVIAFVKGAGVEEKDLKTTNFSIYPRYEWHEVSSYYPTGERVLVGYEVNQSLQVKIRDLTKIGALIQGATEAGANEVSSLQFTIDDQDALKKQAREAAIAEAKTKAKELAEQLDVRLVRISSYNESGVQPLYYQMDYAEEATGKGGGGEPQIETGENKISVTVYLTYEIK